MATEPNRAGPIRPGEKYRITVGFSHHLRTGVTVTAAEVDIDAAIAGITLSADGTDFGDPPDPAGLSLTVDDGTDAVLWVLPTVNGEYEVPILATLSDGQTRVECANFTVAPC